LKFAQLVAIPDKSAPTVSSALFSRLLCKHGLIFVIVSDNGKELCNKIVDTLPMLIRIKTEKQKNTIPYHPRTNGFAEVCN
jgi:hypothetical protein